MQETNVKIEYIAQNTPYQDVVARQEACVADVVQGRTGNTLLFCEHPPIYTCGTSTSMENDYIGGNKIPVIKIGRGGRITYHGPGQRVIYPIIDLTKRGRDLRQYINDLQIWLINSLAEVGVTAHTDDDVGVWVKTSRGEKKIAAIGVRVRKWVTFHGIALNVHPDMSHFNGIVPCGIEGKGVTSLQELGVDISMTEMDDILITQFNKVFNPN
ncbi:MAG: lipoyl(octanoyl) transferase [Alphaproteobacteria bacterium]|jgi:lipoyl(octanoyl) transferase